ncbi:hypothetical protein RB596_000321 [Gaeumannomyces avenae]
MDALALSQPLTEANLGQFQKSLPERRVDEAKHQIYTILCQIWGLKPEDGPESVRIRDSEDVHLNWPEDSDDSVEDGDNGVFQLEYRGSREPDLDLESPEFWDRKLFTFQTVYEPIFELERTKRWIALHLRVIHDFGRCARRFLDDYEIYLQAPEVDIRLLRQRGEAPAAALESLDFWKRHEQYLSWKSRQLAQQRYRWLKSPSPEPMWPPPPSPSITPPTKNWTRPPVDPDESPITPSPPSSPDFRFRKRKETTNVWVKSAPSSEDSLQPPTTQPTYSDQGSIQASLDISWPPFDPNLFGSKRDRAKLSVRDILWGLEAHCGEAGRRVVEAADIYVFGQDVYHRGRDPNPSWENSDVWRAVAEWEEIEANLGLQYRQLLTGTVSGLNAPDKGSKRRRDQLDDGVAGPQKRARPAPGRTPQQRQAESIAAKATAPALSAPKPTAGVRRSARIAAAARPPTQAVPAKAAGLRRSARIAAAQVAADTEGRGRMKNVASQAGRKRTKKRRR